MEFFKFSLNNTLTIKLNDINLSHNKITSIHKSFFDNVKHSLQTINLGHNLLEEVPASCK